MTHPASGRPPELEPLVLEDDAEEEAVLTEVVLEAPVDVPAELVPEALERPRELAVELELDDVLLPAVVVPGLRPVSVTTSKQQPLIPRNVRVIASRFIARPYPNRCRNRPSREGGR